MLGLTQSPFIIEATFKVHFLNYLSNYPEVFENILNDMYVDYLISGGNTVGKVEFLKQKCEELIEKRWFQCTKAVPFDRAHPVAVKGIIHQEVPECVNEDGSVESSS